MWSNFSDARERDRTNAHLSLLRELASHGAEFVPDLISPKDYADMVIHIETFIKADTGAKEGSAIERVREFLSSGELDAVVADAVPKGSVN